MRGLSPHVIRKDDDMSVLKNERSLSKVEFLDKARRIEKITMTIAVKLPKRWTFFLGQPIANLAFNALNCVKAANSLFPENPHEVQTRRDYFIKALSYYSALISQMEIVADFIHIDSNNYQTWSAMVFEEIKLIKAVMKSDKKRYMNIKQ